MSMFPFILSILFPGLGQVLLSRYLKGVLIFFSTIILLDLSFIIFPFILPNTHYQLNNILKISAVLIYLYNLGDIFNIVYYRHRAFLREKKELLIKQGLTYYLQNDIDSAHKEFIKAYKLDKDDIDTIYYLSKAKKLLGKTIQEKRLLRKLVKFDFNYKWE